MNRSRSHSLNRSRHESCPIHWGNGREWKRNGMEKSIMPRHLRNARAVDNSRRIVAAAVRWVGDGA